MSKKRKRGEYPTVLGIDPGTYTGWALCRDWKILKSGTVSFKDIEEKGFGAMFVEFRRFLSKLRTDRDPFVAIAYELPFTGYGAAITGRITTGMAAHILERCAVWRCRALPVNVMTLKKFATGSGKASKEDMMREAQRVKALRMEGLELDEHEADAIHIARWGLNQIYANPLVS